MHSDPKSAIRQSCHQYLLTLLGSRGVKASSKILMKLTHGTVLNYEVELGPG